MNGGSTTADAGRRLAIVRAATFGYAAAWLVVRGQYVLDVARLPERRFAPIGVMAAFDRPPGVTAAAICCAVTLAASVLAAAGRGMRVTAAVAALGMLVIATFTSSFGQVFHTEHLLVLHLLVLAAHALFTRSADTAWDARWALVSLQAVTAATYVVAGVAKLRMSGIDWVTGDVLRSWVAIDNLRKLLLDDPHSPLGGSLAGIGWLWTPIAVLTLAVELGAPLAVAAAWSHRARHVALVWVVAAWVFHIGVLALMAIGFPYQLTGIAYLALLPVERIDAVGRLRARRAAPVGSATA